MKKILIVDDQIEIRELMNITLRTSEYDILQAKDGKEAIKIAIKEVPDLIIMDIIMPGKVDGLEATRIIKNNMITKNCPIIILTSKDSLNVKEKSKEINANGIFFKPFSPLELIKKIEEVLSE